jgi:hypothetical protein
MNVIEKWAYSGRGEQYSGEYSLQTKQDIEMGAFD